MKKLISVILSSALLLALVACGSGNQGNKDAIRIGMIQYGDFEALNQATEGFKAGLKDAGYIEGENLILDEQNAQGDASNCVTIADKFVNAKADLIFANATPAAQAVAGKTSSIPVVITSVTDPASSKLVDSNELPGHNITGTSDLTPVEAQIELLTKLIPNAKNICVMYCSSEDNSVFQANIAKTVIEKAGLVYLEKTVSDSNVIQSVVESLGKVGSTCDAIYIPTDNLLAEGMATVAQYANKQGIPVIVGEEGMVGNGGLATYGINYYNLGYKSGQMAAEILKGADPAKMPIQYLPAEECSKVINQSTAKQIGLSIPESELADATIVG